MPSAAAHKIVRLKIRCASNEQFLAEFAAKIASKLFVPMSEPLSVGSSFTLHMAFLDSQVHVRGTAEVLRVVEGQRTGVHARFLELAPDSLQFPLRSSSLDLASLFEEEPPPPPVPTVPPAAPRDSLDAEEREAPVEQPPPAPAPRHGPPRRQLVAILVGAGLGLLIAVTGLVVLTSRTRTRQTLEVKIADRLSRFEARIAAGQLAGPQGDMALDQLNALQELAPTDPRTEDARRRLATLFDSYANQALKRGDDAEAASQLQALLLADPGNRTAAERLREVEQRVRSKSKK